MSSPTSARKRLRTRVQPSLFEFDIFFLLYPLEVKNELGCLAGSGTANAPAQDATMPLEDVGEAVFREGRLKPAARHRHGTREVAPQTNGGGAVP
jgi:hypothetical protein